MATTNRSDKVREPRCPRCGSVSLRSANKKTGACVKLEGCERRRLRRRKAEDDLRFSETFPWKQCRATTGATTIIFCELGDGHEGPHQRDSRQWGGDYTHPLAAALHAHTSR